MEDGCYLVPSTVDGARDKKFGGIFLRWTMDVSYIQERKIIIGFEEGGGCWILIWRLVVAWFQARWMGLEQEGV